MPVYYFEENKWNELVVKWANDYNVFAPFPHRHCLIYEKVSGININEAIFGNVRPVQPLKFFLYPFQERVVPEIDSLKKTIVIGASNCDLAGLKILDNVFMYSDYKDPNYIKRRENTIIITIDCLKPLSVCFCELVGVSPFPVSGYNLNITKLGSGYLIETGSEINENMFGLIDSVRQAKNEEIQARDEIRKNARSLIRKNNEKFSIFEKITGNFKGIFSSSAWEDVWKNCVQCGSCTNICPSCVCFYLDDISKNENFSKNKIWDSCLFSGYARMASGVSPRPLLSERYRNRFACKYMYMVEHFGINGCTGCGRCIAGCPGKIDKRMVLDCVFTGKVGDVKYESLKYL